MLYSGVGMAYNEGASYRKDGVKKLDMKYLNLLAKEYPTAEAAACEIIKLSAIRSLPKGTEYFFSDLHGEYESFLHLLRSASGMIRAKIDLIFGKSIPNEEREHLAKLIYAPEDNLKRLETQGMLTDEWRKIAVYRLILVCEAVSAKYTRAHIRKKIPAEFSYILDELLNVTEDINKEFYYEEIIHSVLETGISDQFIISLCRLIQSLSVDSLHIIGDIFDRGPRADIIMNELMRFGDVDIQWGNHDISWMGAAAGNQALIANVLRIAIGYNSFDLLEDGYGLNLRALAIFASDMYENDPCTLFYPHLLDDNVYDPVDVQLAAKMHKAIAVIQFKLEGQLIRRHPEYGMEGRSLFAQTDFGRGAVLIDGKEYPLRDREFPTVFPDDPLRLTDREAELMEVLSNSFRHSRLLQTHVRFLYAHGGMYQICNHNLLYHGCIPMTEGGQFQTLCIQGKEYFGRRLLDRLNELVNLAYFAPQGSAEQADACDFMWYLWCGPRSPLYGKDKSAAFERTFLEDKELSAEQYNPYYRLSQEPEVCDMLLDEFGIDREKGHIINGHVPVRLREGESPIKAGGKLFIIDGGISKAYQSKTGIAGYTLIYDSHSLRLAEHRPYSPQDREQTPAVRVVEKMKERVNIADTDLGRELAGEISDLTRLLEAYRTGLLRER